VLWSNDAESGFRFSWTESGGPTVVEPSKKGFGSRLIDRVLAADFEGEVHTYYRQCGVVCELMAPMVGSAASG
jgi:two-component sensor histidine kinase